MSVPDPLVALLDEAMAHIAQAAAVTQLSPGCEMEAKEQLQEQLAEVALRAQPHLTLDTPR